jgi:glycosyltransferase involved in cell wall biosynthesis
MYKLKLSVVICAYNPKPVTFNKVLESLKNQTLSNVSWELIIIDNNSQTAIATWVDLSWHPNARVVVEKEPGLIHARNRATLEASYEYLISVDDDTPLFKDYLDEAGKIFTENPSFGIIGGRSYPIYEAEPPQLIENFKSFLAIRDLGEEIILDKLLKGDKIKSYPNCAPILIAPTKKCMLLYKDFFDSNEISKNLGRKGASLASGEDNDINLFIYKSGFTLGYFPQLKFYHIIPKERLEISYLKRMAFESNRSWVKVLNNHGICPWKPISPLSFPLRKLKSYIKNKPWKSEINTINYFSSLGILKGLSEIKKNNNVL